LDSQFKKLKFITKTQYDITIDKLKQLYRTEQANIAKNLSDNLSNLPNLSELLTLNKSSNINQNPH